MQKVYHLRAQLLSDFEPYGLSEVQALRACGATTAEIEKFRAQPTQTSYIREGNSLASHDISNGTIRYRTKESTSLDSHMN